MHELTITRSFNTSLNNLFRAWCDPALLQQWFAPGDMTVAGADADPKIGGHYRIAMQSSDGKEQSIVSGEYREIHNNEKLVFSWQWASSPLVTRVTITFRALENNRSELTLVHREFPDEATRDKHTEGWTGCLDRLDRLYSPV